MMNNYQYKISVVVPVYGVKDYIEMSVESICRQDFKGFELILVDDGSPDNSIELAEKVLKRYEQVRYRVISQENKGLPTARNTGLRAAEGEYICYIDSDDVITPDYLSSLYAACELNQTKAAFTDYEVVHLNQRNGHDDVDKGVSILSREELLRNNMLRSIRIHLCAMMIQHDFIKEHDLYFNESLRYGEEVDYTWRMFPLLERVSYIRAAKYKYLVRKGSLMTAQQAEKVICLLNHMHSVLGELTADKTIFSDQLRWIEDKIYFEKMHAFGQQSNYREFKDLLKATSYKTHFCGLKDFPNSRIAGISRIAVCSKYMLWVIFRLF